MKAKQIRKITDGSIIVAIYGLIFLISRFLGGQLEYNLSFLMPIPLAIFAFKYDLKNSIVPFVASIVISFLLSINPLNVLVFNIPYLFIGSLLGGLLIKKELKPIYSILILTLITSITEVLGSIALASFLGFENIFVDIQNMTLEMEKLFGVNTGDFAIIQALMEGLIPSIIIIISLMNSLVTYLLFVILVKRIFKYNFSSKVLSFFSLNNLIPKWISCLYILICISSFILLPLFFESEGALRVLIVILVNLTFIVGAIYIYFGIRVASLFIKLKNKKPLLILEFVLLIAFPIFFVIVGLVDNFISLQTKLYNKSINHTEN